MGSFANAICLQYEEQRDEFVDDYPTDSDVDSASDEEAVSDNHGMGKSRDTVEMNKMSSDHDNEEVLSAKVKSLMPAKKVFGFKGCPVLKFQVVNDFSNRTGGEFIDAM